MLIIDSTQPESVSLPVIRLGFDAGAAITSSYLRLTMTSSWFKNLVSKSLGIRLISFKLVEDEDGELGVDDTM